MNYLHPFYFLPDYKTTTQIFPSGSKHGLLTTFLARGWPDLLFVPSSHVTHGDSKPSQSRAPSVIPKPSVISNMIIGRHLPFKRLYLTTSKVLILIRFPLKKSRVHMLAIRVRLHLVTTTQAFI